jgi:hypothetical protein
MQPEKVFPATRGSTAGRCSSIPSGGARSSSSPSSRFSSPGRPRKLPGLPAPSTPYGRRGRCQQRDGHDVKQSAGPESDREMSPMRSLLCSMANT